jgi:hypothetical protein
MNAFCKKLHSKPSFVEHGGWFLSFRTFSVLTRCEGFVAFFRNCRGPRSLGGAIPHEVTGSANMLAWIDWFQDGPGVLTDLDLGITKAS